jgi:AcrR family transcriptional regulator
VSVAQQLAQSDRRAQRRAEQKERSRRDILDAAERVFGEYGIHDGSTRKIADESGFSSASIYFFFENKQHLLAETLQRRSDELIQMVAATGGPGITPLDRLHRIVDVTLDFFADRPHFRLMLRHVRGGPTITWPILGDYSVQVHARYLQALNDLAELMKLGQKSGQIRNGDAYDLGRLFTVMVTEFILFDSDRIPSDGGMSLPGFHDFLDGAFRSS